MNCGISTIVSSSRSLFSLIERMVRSIPLDEITLSDFQRLLQEEKPIDERTLEEAFETLYKDVKGNAKTIDYNRFRADITEVR